ncbi:alkene reductase [Paenibacillus sp. MER 99-2]|uniref:oxidoreductase n=1 Tax=Paenibacillus sp. MER 99-2 TaxID=2939572 RepID=UPI002041957D|nr:alkene reductase [Paenibacillus sp. MER 99-2]MCM3174796.1 alkene reductase [Paenibacillus sp. MER 99-2]
MNRLSSLLSPVNINQWKLRNRVVMAPLTRGFAMDQDGTVTEEMVAYYERRARYGVGLIITEGINPSLAGKGTFNIPGLYTAKQTNSWKRVTEAVHGHGATIIAQLWHVGRLAHSDLIGHPPLAPSAIQAEGRVHKLHKPYEMPTPMSTSDIHEVIASYRLAARNAMQAGFDGVEIHAAHGYLIDQFINERTNVRIDAYGGDVSGRLRFLREVVEAVKEEVHVDRISVRISEKKDDDPTYAWRDKAGMISSYLDLLRELNITVLHPSTEEFTEIWAKKQNLYQIIRRQWEGTIIGVGHLDADTAEAAIREGIVDLAAFGRPFIANPDLVQRWSESRPLVDYNPVEHLPLLL